MHVTISFQLLQEEFTTCTSGTCSKCGTSNKKRPKNEDVCRWPPTGPVFTEFQCTEGCTYEGSEYSCWRDRLFPWMNGQYIPNNMQRPENANIPFAIHVGDFLKGRGSGDSGRCNPDSFESRLNLFSGKPCWGNLIDLMFIYEYFM